ncbi:MAG: hypothetical protein AAGA23_20315 [Pseudomonadota bacterium]
MSSPALTIRGFTVAVPDLDAAVAAYRDYLDYQPTWRGTAEALATLWQAPEAADQPCAVLVPGARPETFLRLVELPQVDDYVPFSTQGWNAAEIAVADVDALAERLADSPFKILGPPAELSISDDIRAMQVVGPGGELLYLTQVKAPIPGFDLPILAEGVGHCFVAIVGGKPIAAVSQTYELLAAAPPAPVVDARVQALSLAFDLDREHRHPICALSLSPGFLIEMDQMPEASPRPHRLGLPAAMFSIALTIDHLPEDLAAVKLPDGGRAALIKGAADEWIELEETGS